MNNNTLRNGAHNAYEQLVKGTPFLILLISGSVSVVLSILGNGIWGVVSQIIPVLIMVGLFLARSVNRTGVRMVQICAAILFWLNCIICGAVVVISTLSIIGAASLTNDASAVAGSIVALIVAMVVIVLQFFFPILYNRDIQLIMKDIAGWFVGPDGNPSAEFPPESRRRVSCRLVLLCILQLILSGITAMYLLSMMTGSSLTANIGGSILNGITGGGSGQQLLSLLIPGPSIFTILAQAAVITKYICVILLYKQYIKTETRSHHRKDPEPAPAPKPAPVSIPVTDSRPAQQPAPKNRSVRIILERKSPKEGRFSASMTSSMIVGRKEGEAKIVIKDDPSISGRHMKLMIRENKLYAEDLGSYNGTFVNGRKIEKTQQIHRGDEIRLGNSVFILKWET